MKSCAQEGKLMRYETYREHLNDLLTDLQELKEKAKGPQTCVHCKYETLPWGQEPCKGCQTIMSRFEPKEVDNGTY